MILHRMNTEWVWIFLLSRLFLVFFLPSAQPLVVDIHLWKFMLIRIEFRRMQSLAARHLRSFLIWFNLSDAVKEERSGDAEAQGWGGVLLRNLFFFYFPWMTLVLCRLATVSLSASNVKKFPQGLVFCGCVVMICWISLLDVHFSYLLYLSVT